MLDGTRINKVAVYISVFAAASALFITGVLTLKCTNDWADKLSGVTFITLGVGLWIWNGLVGIYAALNLIDFYALKHRHRLPLFRLLGFSALFGIVVISGITVSRIAFEIELRGSRVCSS